MLKQIKIIMNLNIERIATKVIKESKRGEKLGSSLSPEELHFLLNDLLDEITEYSDYVCDKCNGEGVIEIQTCVDDFEEFPCHDCSEYED